MNNYKISAFGDEISDNLNVQIAELKRHRIDYLDIRSIEKYNILELTDAYILKVKQLLDANEIKVSSIASPIGKNSIDEHFGKSELMMRRAVRIAELLECQNIRIFSFYKNSSIETSFQIESVMSRVRRFVDIAQNTGLTVLLENEKGTIADEPEIAKQIFDRIKMDNFKSVFDIANYVRSGIDVKKAFNILWPNISALHMKDAISKTDMVVPCGQGDGQILEILTLLFERKVDVCFAIEPHLKYYLGKDEKGNILLNTKKKENNKKKEEVFSYAYNECLKIIDKVRS